MLCFYKSSIGKLMINEIYKRQLDHFCNFFEIFIGRQKIVQIDPDESCPKSEKSWKKSPFFFWLCLHIYSFVPSQESGGHFSLKSYRNASSKKSAKSEQKSHFSPKNPTECNFKINSFWHRFLGGQWPPKVVDFGGLDPPSKVAKVDPKTRKTLKVQKNPSAYIRLVESGKVVYRGGGLGQDTFFKNS